MITRAKVSTRMRRRLQVSCRTQSEMGLYADTPKPNPTRLAPYERWPISRARLQYAAAIGD